jgi:mannose-6-phosphate isomerase-like protein (cupin superfamily)
MEATLFDDLVTSPENQIFQVVFYPDRVYHARYLNATRSPRYRYNVREVRNAMGVMVMKGQVFLDDRLLTNFVRIEYKPDRLIEVVRERNRFVEEFLIGWARLLPDDEALTTESQYKLHYCPWIDAYQVEFWETLEPPAGSYHDYKVTDMMGKDGAITRLPSFSVAMGTTLDSLKGLRRFELAFRENDRDLPLGYFINNPAWDNNIERLYQVPNSNEPSSNANNVRVGNYLLDFQRGYLLEGDKVQSIRYLNAMMNPENPDRAADNIINMKWYVQRELGSSMVFFHEVTIPPGKVEGTHRHIGTEELYYIVEGQGTLFLGENDDPKLAALPTKEVDVLGYGPTKVKEVTVKPGDALFTKSGGVHGVRNDTDKPLRFVAFLYHTQ